MSGDRLMYLFQKRDRAEKELMGAKYFHTIETFDGIRSEADVEIDRIMGA